jgi:dolichol-phosphate mannosyltransferase
MRPPVEKRAEARHSISGRAAGTGELRAVPAASAPDDRTGAGRTSAGPELAVIVPTLNERGNVTTLVDRLERCLGDRIRWEVVFVDDDSDDGTGAELSRLAHSRPNVRYLRRIGRRGLASASIEGMMATTAPYLAIMDADLQHDETILPEMLATLVADEFDVVIGTRYAAGGSAGNLSAPRRLMSRAGGLLSRAIVRAELSDPMSGFMMIRREFLERTVHRLSGCGFKILLDLFASAPGPVRFAEIPYHFGQRRRGESKLDALIVLEYLQLLLDKTVGRWLPTRFVIFVLVGTVGLFFHLTLLALAHKTLGLPFYLSQALATLLAMTLNFNLNNLVTYRDQRLKGADLVRGHLSFYVVCTVGALANLAIAEWLFRLRAPWFLAGFLGAVVGSVWNYGVSSTFTWRRGKA